MNASVSDVSRQQVRPSLLLRRQRTHVLETVSRFRASEPRMFGSVARGDDEPGSDVDVVVTFAKDASLLDEVGLRLALTELLGVEVDVVGSDALRGEFGERVRLEAVPL